MNDKDNSWDLSDLERDIEAAVDTLFVEKEGQANPVTQPKGVHAPYKEVRAANRDYPSPTAPPTQERGLASRALQEKLEEVEAQLLTLEWDISSKHINRALTLLQDLRRLPHGVDELEIVIILIQKVLYQLLLDESKLNPTALKFLQKSWKVAKGMTDERFSFEIDKVALVKELKAEFQRLGIEEKAPKEKKVEIREMGGEEIVTQKPPEEKKTSFEGIKRLIDRIEELEKAVKEENKRLGNIHQAITSYKTELQRQFGSGEEFRGELEGGGEEIADLNGRLERGSYSPSDIAIQEPAKVPTMAVSLFGASGVVFGLPDNQILKSFLVKKWVADFFIKSGRVKLKEMEIPLLNLFQVFKLRPSTEEKPLILIVRGREDRTAAVIVDQAISREEIEYHPIEGKPYILGKGVSGKGGVWILDVEQISL